MGRGHPDGARCRLAEESGWVDIETFDTADVRMSLGGEDERQRDYPLDE